MAARQGGFTLIEMMVAVAIMGILTSAFVSMGNLVREYRVGYVGQRLYNALLLARSEAIKRSAVVSVCKSRNGASCATGAGAGWEAGWLVFVDVNGNRVVEGNDRIIRVYNGIPDVFRIRWSHTQYLSFDSRGRVNVNTDQRFRVCLAYASPGPVRTITVFGRRKGGGRVAQPVASSERC